MTVSEYVKDCIAKDEYQTAEALALDGVLAAKFGELRESSELKVAEYGVNLYWNSVASQLTLGDEVLGGTKTAVDLKTKTVRNSATYIGDCHTHPYRQKMGGDAQLGPSTGDYLEWWYYPPTGFDIALHFVVGGDTLFLLMMRKKTSRKSIMVKGHDVDSAFGELGKPPDTGVLGVVQTKSMNDETFNKAYVAAFEKDNYEAQRALYTKYFPSLASDFSYANLRMNLDLAAKLEFEYFSGTLSSGASPTCRLALKSSLLYGSAFARWRVEFNRNPTLL